MPPKSWPPRRTPRTTARKSTPIAKVSAKSTADESPLITADVPTSTTTTTQEPPSSVLISPKAITSPSPEHNTTTKSSPKTTPLASPENADDKMTSITTMSGHVSEESQAPIVPFGTNSQGDAESTVQTPIEVALAHKTGNVGIEAPAGDNVSESGPKTGVKTMVKKTVRVVKKLVKKKVPKKVQKGPVSPTDEGEKLEAGNDGARPTPCILGEVEVNDNPNLVDSVSMEVENPNPNETFSMEIEQSESNIIVSMDAQNLSSNPSASISMDVEKPSAYVDVSRNVENSKEFEISEREKDGFSNESISEVPVVGVEANPVGDVGEKGICVTGALLEDQSMALTGHQNDEHNNENANLEKCEGEEGVMEEAENKECSDLKMDAGLSDRALKTENANCKSVVGEEKVKEQMEKSDCGLGVERGLGDTVLLSGEMEALERRRRRKTEIFIGGLDKEAKEEDLRKVFEQVGEVRDVKLVKDGKTGKSKGFAFLRYASAADAKMALEKFREVEICGKQCGTEPVEGNDTIFLGNIDKRWKSEHVLKHLQEIGIEKIDTVTVAPDPENIELNRGFAFIELETKKDAQTAYNKLQTKDIFGKHLKIKVAWAEPLIEPDEEEMLKVKSVYAEYLPSSWDEAKVKDYFKSFGEIETVALARNLRSSRRKDFAFVNYESREAALACIEAFSREQLNDDGSKVNVKVSLAKPIPRSKQIKHISKAPAVKPSKEKRKAAQVVLKPPELGNMGKSTSGKYEDARVDRISSTTAELVQLLREQASWRQGGSGSNIGAGPVAVEFHHPSPGGKRPFAVLGGDPLYSDPRGYRRKRLESSYAIANPRSLSHGVGMPSLPDYNRQESFYRIEDNPRYFQTRDRAPSGVYRSHWYK